MRLALLALAREADKGGRFTLRRKEIGALLGCSLDTVDRRIKALEGEGLLTVERVPRKNGYGPSKYTLSLNAAGRSVAATHDNAAGRTVAAQGQRKSAARGNAEVRPPETAKVAATGAASIRKPSTPVEEIELNSEREESGFESDARERETVFMPLGPGELNMAWAVSPEDRAFANERGYLNGSCDELFAKFLDRCATKGPRISTRWRSEWHTFVRNEVRYDTERAQRNKANTHDNASSTSLDGIRVRGEPVSAATAARMRRQAERKARDQPIDLGRVASVRIE